MKSSANAPSAPEANKDSSTTNPRQWTTCGWCANNGRQIERRLLKLFAHVHVIHRQLIVLADACAFTVPHLIDASARVYTPPHFLREDK